MVNYVEKIKTEQGAKTIGGAQFDDAWYYQQVTMASAGTTIAAGGTKTFSLSSYLPNDGCDYMVQIFAYLTSGATSGDIIGADAYSGSSASGYCRRISRILTRTSSTQISAGTVELPIKASDRAFTIKNGDGNGTGSYEIFVSGYKRLGTNGKSKNYISKIRIPKKDLVVGGKILDGQPVYKPLTLASSISIAASGTKTISLASHLPNDGCDYLCYFNLTNIIPATNNASNTLRLCIGTGTSLNRPVCRGVARSAATRYCAGNIVLKIPASDRNVTIYNTGGAATSATTLYMRAYRRTGSNKLSNGNFISNVNDVLMGGDIADGQWVYKNGTIFSAVAFADEAAGDETYTITNYLPTNNELYEVLIQGYSRTGATSGNGCTMWVNGNGVSTHQVISYINTRTASNECDGKSGILFLKQNSSGQATVSVDMTSAAATGNCGLYLVGYRRIGSNT